MANNFYFSNDGTIHKNPSTVVNNSGNPRKGVDNNYEENIRTGNQSLYLTSDDRNLWFWIFSIITSFLIGLGSYQTFGVQIFGNDGGFYSTIGPYIMVIGAIAGSFLYGKNYAVKLDYNLWTYFLSFLFSLLGIVASVIAVFVISLIVMIILTILGIAAGIGIICAISGDM